MIDSLDPSRRGRMLLSHNFALSDGLSYSNVHPLNRAQFAEVFSTSLSEQPGLSCTLIDNPHWIVEICYDSQQYSPADIGQLCADSLADYRKNRQEQGFKVMALGGVKSTPPTSPPPALQTGEWGVDVVETGSPEVFLAEINWDKLAGAKPPQDIFKIERSV